ncbi:YggS family pyridoxal phosphate-dependent enzyme [Priestia megaterium]|nr:YggS family pyridoxal phosphate-dependent enzyme [Priestia megaterium]
MTASVLENLEKIEQTILETCQKEKRNREDIQIIAVTKYVSINRAKEAIGAGVTQLGENRDEGLLQKYDIIGNEATWHFIGTLQTRKVKNIIDKVDYIHSLDRLSLAKEIDKRAKHRIKCFIQVNVAEEESKHGLSVEEVLPFVEAVKDFSNIEIVGLMTMAPHTDNEQVLRNCFRTLKQLQVHVQELSLSYAPCTELSMGMSNDYAIAIEEGATFIRLGTTLVGSEC